ncbi:type II and III secretion system protein family protein [Amphritea sp. HPY]|uniref:type II and III secretion system protein family protein n=1 Tax=Amphritea sp. HPY TaxID=3421652 RepID=UPI003D7D9F23
MQYIIQPKQIVGVLIVLMFLLSGSPVLAQDTSIRSTKVDTFSELTDHQQQLKTIWVPLYKSHILELNTPVKKISIGNPSIADILVMQSGQLYILGRGLGTTNVLLWDSRNRLISAFDIEVTHDLDTLKAKLYDLLPGEDIRVHSSQGTIVLSGQVTSLIKMNTAVEIAKSFARPTKQDDEEISSVVNLMSVGGAQQVMLKVTVAEISRTVMKKLGIKFRAVRDGGGDFIFGALAPGGLTSTDIPSPEPLLASTRSLFGSYIDDSFMFNMAIEAAKENGSAKVLAEPTLTTLSGQQANFLSGGEFPIPVPDEDGITIQFKEFGIGLKFVPVVLDSDQINLKLNISVSELTNVASVKLSGAEETGLFVPALTKRSASATVELADGQTMSIAGLMNENMREVVSKFPGLGDIPILGHLFRSQEFEKGETELVIMVTPVLAKPIDPNQIDLPTDNFVEPSDFEFYLLGRNLGTPPAAQDDSAVDQQSATESDPAAIEPAQESAVQETTATSYAAPPQTTVSGNTGGLENNYGHSMN